MGGIKRTDCNLMQFSYILYMFDQKSTSSSMKTDYTNINLTAERTLYGILWTLARKI
jgi:hypothetical protein